MFKGKELTKNLVKRESIDPLTRWPEKTKSFLFLFWSRYQHRFTWKVWAALFVVVFGGVGFLATWQLLNMQKSPNCPKIFWPIASASLRLYCAQLSADSRTVAGLLEAIALVEALPEDHPLRSQVNQQVEEWARDILNLAEKDYQAGNLKQAIAKARQIPSNMAVAAIIEERIAKWQGTWTEGNVILSKLEENLRASNWNQSFRLAVDLLNLNNEYWATIKYNEAIAKITVAREDSSKLDNAFNLFARGGLDNWFKVIEEARKIPASSYAYQEAQKLIAKTEDKLKEYAERLIERKQWQALRDLANQTPKDLKIKADVTDWSLLSEAALDAETGTVDGLEAGILGLEQIDASRPLHQTALAMKERWQLQVQDLKILSEARDLAQAGTIEQYSAAIAKAGEVPRNNPLWSQAQQEIGSWNRQIQVIEDRPILERAREIAIPGDINSLSSAIIQARAIGKNRALYRDAQREIRDWQARIERMEDQPILDQAQALANLKDYSTAIETANQIPPGRALSSEVSQNIRRWRRELRASQNLQQANQLAATGSAEGLTRAIALVTNISTQTDAGVQRTELLERWSYQLLSLATARANNGSYLEAIRLAESVSRESTAYSSARSQMQGWRNILQPPAPPPIVESTPLSPESPIETPSPGQ
ncbi:MAG: chromosome segregation ATPase [Microcystis panniformis Mp_MB_F_20051200_S9]|uniref:Chromosome segregation ATPase n=1 Tax=Microcystis panniformis Mp_MB_F_20051200_S9 TaxID=2486223 RepID=A0A552PY38_9CHRO|nr:MAG: chromosome segregation ATPase [Microcystis panniformis Mp_GB_SS_20050300_S99]TRV45294.1 MAG: chromosome segregation ATPase [Microcystis panniformis Mp_GB_SS_20050300_S99D]TRV51073.1 MAG: chromosome segregation ATPase [Microcystis panniformis Mp_MB_F_20080800_S26D]TRV60512.1 MAG: chromosome segregation ATPase [Microcystis panniformis Mp_MB_F_20080800_S26]TRV61859.1 MAG: chromosome segregation ATPase [Microcystis panniformis Mp_MB_F_20051200_S9]TRV63445.1 MAG: chromosome segregation ATPa